MAGLRRLMKEFGLKRDEDYTWEKKKAVVDMKKAFKQPLVDSRDEL